ncbi:class I SAM-dependent methyltransferase [Streptomyces sp. NPDC088097]|uniref:class I SAM-dependent methyltransferase n=1 Tax=Streptomyces sp. NPDC088097 TaxID=3365823 RepID=UPI00380FCD31
MSEFPVVAKGEEQEHVGAKGGSAPFWHTVTAGGRRLRLRVKRDAALGGRPYLWPSVGEYPLYDDFLYHVMLEDEPRNKIFRDAIEARAPHARVLEVGCGPDLLWSLYAAECGARSVRAIESIPDSARRATELAAKKPQFDIEVLSGEATTVAVPERAGVCVAELVGSIGGAEGMAAVLDDVRERLLTPGAAVIPAVVGTLAAAVGLQELLEGEFAVDVDFSDYVAEVLACAGGPFDLRMCVGNVDRSALRSSEGLVEDLQLEEGVARFPAVRLDITRPGPVDGLLLWLTMRCTPDGPVLDSLETVTNWLPVYVPFDAPEPVEAAPGDVLALECAVRPAADGLHPEYTFTGALVRADGRRVPLSAHSPYAGGPFRASPLHRALFAEEA